MTVYPVTFLELYPLCFTMFSIYIVKITVIMYVKSIDRVYFFVQHLISYESYERFPYVFYNKN